MTAHLLVTRRMLIKDMGKAGLAIVVLGAAACSSDPTQNATPTEEAGDATSMAPTSTTAEAASTASTDAITSTSGVGAGHDWLRVNLDFVSAYVLYRAGEAAVVDTGVGGSEGSIEQTLGEVGLAWGDVGHVIITHEHPDHQGSAQAVLAASSAPWYAGTGDIGSITAPSAGTAVGDGDSVFDLQIIDTPGHTPGHISVLDPISGILVAGDALNGDNGAVTGPNPQFSSDMDVANSSVVKLAEFDYEIALFGHGEPVLEGASSQVAELAESLG
jgi:glyoxylase-like metal-dependent hydrolase (beta-lactamase superfamily II)